MIKRLSCLLLLLAACARVPVTEELTIEPDADSETVVVTESSTFLLNPPNDQLAARVESARAAAMSGSDPWSIRFARLSTPEEERITVQKKRGRWSASRTRPASPRTTCSTCCRTRTSR